MTLQDLHKLDLAYARFNAERTFGDERTSAFRVERVGNLLVSADPAREARYYNRILGLETTTLADLDDALTLHTDIGVPTRVDLSDEAATEDVLEALTERGFEASSQLVWVGADPTGLATKASSPAIDVRIERWGDEGRDRFLAMLAAEFPIPDEMLALRGSLYCTDTFRAFVAVVGDEPISRGTTFVHEDMAVFGNAKTLEGYERQGLHTALIHARLEDARALGLRWVTTDCEPDTTSLRNWLRAGLQHIATVTTWKEGAREESARS